MKDPPRVLALSVSCCKLVVPLPSSSKSIPSSTTFGPTDKSAATNDRRQGWLKSLEMPTPFTPQVMPAPKSRFPQGDPATQVTPHRWPQETNPDPDTHRLLRVDAHLNNTQARTSLSPFHINHTVGGGGGGGRKAMYETTGRDLLGRCPYATDATYYDVEGPPLQSAEGEGGPSLGASLINQSQHHCFRGSGPPQ